MRGDPRSEVASRAVRRRNSGIKTGGHEGDSSWCQRANMDGWMDGREREGNPHRPSRSRDRRSSWALVSLLLKSVWDRK